VLLDSVGLLTVPELLFTSVCPYYITQALLIYTLKMEEKTASETMVICIKLSGDTCRKNIKLYALVMTSKRHMDTNSFQFQIAPP
jgi:hypothetical protein